MKASEIRAQKLFHQYLALAKKRQPEIFSRPVEFDKNLMF
jgi:hypothetical protein